MPKRSPRGAGSSIAGKLAVVVIASPKASDKIPPVEQTAVGRRRCAWASSTRPTAAGWGAYWLSGWPAHDAVFAARAFGCDRRETVAGIVHIGTAARQTPPTGRAPTLPRLITLG